MSTQITIEKILEYLPNITKLCWNRFEDSLMKQTDIIQQCVRSNSLIPLYKSMEKNMGEYSCPMMQAYIGELAIKMKLEYPADQVREAIARYDTLIRQVIRERDPYNPIRQFVRHYGDMWFFYSLELNIDKTMIHDDADRWIERERIKRALGVLNNGHQSHNVNQHIDELITNSAEGGELRVYFKAPLHQLIHEKQDFREVQICGKEVFIAIVNPGIGIGYDITLPINITIPFNREDLCLDQAMRYSYIDDLYSRDIEHWNDNTAFIPLARYSGREAME